MNENPVATVIILNWNGWKDTVRCLESLYQSTYRSFIAIVIDNGSEDESVTKIKAWAKGNLKTDSTLFQYTQRNKPIDIVEYVFSETKTAYSRHTGDGLIIIKNKKNYGFAQGNNIGVACARQCCNPDYIMFLNNDTVIAPGSLEALIHTAESNTQAGACQPKMLSLAEPDIIDAVGIAPGNLYAGAVQVGYGIRDTGQHKTPTEIFGACAGAALYRRETLEQIGLFDEKFFAYYEDVDLALRSRLAGWKAMLVPEGIVYHAHSATLGMVSPLKTYLLERNRYYYVIKCLPFKLAAQFLVSRPLFIWRTMRRFLKNGDFRLALACLKGNIAALLNIPFLISRRRIVRSLQSVSNSEVEGWFKK